MVHKLSLLTNKTCLENCFKMSEKSYRQVFWTNGSVYGTRQMAWYIDHDPTDEERDLSASAIFLNIVDLTLELQYICCLFPKSSRHVFITWVSVLCVQGDTHSLITVALVLTDTI